MTSAQTKNAAGRRESRSEQAESVNLRAQAKWEAGELRSAFRLMQTAAKLGAYAAKHNLGYFYDVGIGVKRNRNAALYWYRRAFREDNVLSANNIGTIYRDEMKTSLALRWFHRAVARGDVDANLNIAKLYLNRLGDSRTAVSYLKHVLKAKGGIDVTIDSQEQATALLKKLHRPKPKATRSSQECLHAQTRPPQRTRPSQR
ncbi:MAG TPA: hypothetical protein VGI45_09780 [Terracidiphilus sp.]